MVTKDGSIRALAELGISRGMILGVHCALSSFGRLEGGAMTVIDTLKELVAVRAPSSCPHCGQAPNISLPRKTRLWASP
ncbi:hypothetical protein [Ruminococcus sp.]|uniref:hypothetical protein n=1 Tax=Ruminococcus sp. TaxID=41978 RepID=UPI0025F4ACB4|nr:hypothetical protein [Ruminococcus sp.]MBQ8966574.1 hypothetical protein [Ruminococcus sp.]